MSNNFIPTTQADKDQIAGVIEEISNSMTMIEDRRSYINDAKKSLKEDWEFDMKTINALIKTRHKRNIEEVNAQHEELNELYDALF